MKNKQSLKSNKGLVKAICGSLLVGIPAITLTSVAMPVAQLNPESKPFLRSSI
jgi:ascorbate-specific PTS system EIIC-type component UlaA